MQEKLSDVACNGICIKTALFLHYSETTVSPELTGSTRLPFQTLSTNYATDPSDTRKVVRLRPAIRLCEYRWISMA